MRSYELQPTYENLLRTFVDDTIARNPDILQFVSILNSLDDKCSIALDGNWGSGKTFFVKQVKMVLDAHNDYIDSFDEEDRKIIQNIWARYFKAFEVPLQPQVCVYYDAWENDNDEDPVLSLVYSILSSIQTDFSFKRDADYMKIAATILEFFSGKKFGQLIESFKSGSPLMELETSKDIEKKVCEFLNSLLIEKGNRLVVLIDELDRCKPSYAVKLLERIKHYFSNDRITFVFSINANELQNTIKRYYGDDFDAYRYLDRFFDLRISLPPADLQRYFQSLNFSDDHWSVDVIIGAVIKAYHFELREIAKYLRLVKIAVYEVTHDNRKSDFVFPDERAIQFGLIYVVPIMIGLKIYNSHQYYRFIHGEDYSPMLTVTNYLSEDFFGGLLSRTETYDEKEKEKALVSIPNKLKEVYNALFVSQFTRNAYEINIGNYTFSKKTKETILKAASLLSNYSNYDID